MRVRRRRGFLGMCGGGAWDGSWVVDEGVVVERRTRVVCSGAALALRDVARLGLVSKRSTLRVWERVDGPGEKRDRDLVDGPVEERGVSFVRAMLGEERRATRGRRWNGFERN